MDISNLEEKQHLLIAYMKKADYSTGYIDKFKAAIKYVLESASSDSIKCYADIYLKYEQTESRKWKLYNQRSLIRMIELFDLYEKYPDRHHKSSLIPVNSYHLLNAENKAIVDCYERNVTGRQLNETTIYGHKAIASSFLLQLQQLGVERLSDATEENILSLFTDSDGKFIRHYSCNSKFSRVLKICIPSFPECAVVLAFLPALRNRRKNIQYLTRKECAKLKETLFSNTSHLTLRNKAMGILALFTGLRGCDIAGLKKSAIDWDNDIIHIKQQKTGVHLNLPLSAIVGNAIHDYIEFERPKTDCEYIFVSETHPDNRIKRMGNVASTIMKAADIRQSKGDRKGTHIFRHHLASRLLENGVPRPVISSITGQNSPKSLDTYLSTDFVHLKKCSIGVDNFPLAKEVFAR